MVRHVTLPGARPAFRVTAVRSGCHPWQQWIHLADRCAGLCAGHCTRCSVRAGHCRHAETPSEDVRTAPGERPLAEEAERRRRVQAEHVRIGLPAVARGTLLTARPLARRAGDRAGGQNAHGARGQCHSVLEVRRSAPRSAACPSSICPDRLPTALRMLPSPQTPSWMCTARASDTACPSRCVSAIVRPRERARTRSHLRILRTCLCLACSRAWLLWQRTLCKCRMRESRVAIRTHERAWHCETKQQAQFRDLQ